MSQIKIEYKDNAIWCYLPITLPTSKVRVKRELSDKSRRIIKPRLGPLIPIATRKEILREEDLIEWQISYFDKQLGKLIELGEMLYLAAKNGLITKHELHKLLDYAEKIDKTFEQKFQFDFVESNEEFEGFRVGYERFPVLYKELEDNCKIKIILRHKQRAVGYQAMIFLYIPLKNVITGRNYPPIVGRKAYSKEYVIWKASKNHIFELTRAFIIASDDHKKDIKNIISNILQELF